MSKDYRILLVDDEPIKCEILKDALMDEDYEVALATNALEAERLLNSAEFDVIITDLRMPGKDGLTFLREVKKKNPQQAMIVMTAYASVEDAVEAMKNGAFDFLQKPFSAEELILKLDRLTHYENLLKENQALRKKLVNEVRPKLVGSSDAMRELKSTIHRVAASDSTVLLQGESGTGKEVVARLIHESSHRSKGPFIPVACAALPETLVESELFGHEAGAFTGAAKGKPGRFELAAGGTIFLDDVDDVPLNVQVRLLRVLQERSIVRVGGTKPVLIDVRVIAATKVNLQALVQDGAFRQDLLYRLSVIPVLLPPLRDRKDDIPLLVKHFTSRFAARHGRPDPEFSAEAMEVLKHHSWPGNVRELEHVVERVVALIASEEILPEHIPLMSQMQAATDAFNINLEDAERIDLQKTLIDIEARIVDWAMERSNGNLAKAAEMLSVPRSTLQYRIQKLSTSSSEL